MEDLMSLTKNPLETADAFDKNLQKDTSNPGAIVSEYANAPYTLIKRWGEASKKPMVKNVQRRGKESGTAV